MFAKLTGFYQTVDPASRFLLSKGWKEVTWVPTAREATKLSQQYAERLVGELEDKEPGPIYGIQRDENGESNVAPYGLDNFVVHRIQEGEKS